MEMTIEQKFQALQALCKGGAEAAIYMREPGNWYVFLGGVCIKEKSLLASASGPTGTNPFDAIGKAWEVLTALSPDEHIVIYRGNNNRRSLRWNGFMWADIEEDTDGAS